PIPDDLASRENADQGVAERPREAARRRTTVKNGRESRNPLSNQNRHRPVRGCMATDRHQAPCRGVSMVV
ncbi:hypothetical protein, partial [Gordonibacter sp. 28C]|uniref:hypothetical protein n=1 Tax=Gordonibacter sp. 28C TaxID=2078569 RepID=UPI001A7E057C